MNKIERFKIMDKVFLISIGLIIFFAWTDAKQITTFFIINTPEAWELYNTYTGPAIWQMWYIVILAIGLIWYFISKDKSESIGLVASLWALIWFGTQDVFYFIFSGKAMTVGMCWANGMFPIKTISSLLGETCPTQLSFMLSALLGIFVAYKLYNWLKEAKW